MRIQVGRMTPQINALSSVDLAEVGGDELATILELKVRRIGIASARSPWGFRERLGGDLHDSTGGCAPASA